MPDETQSRIDEAERRGRFEGRVLTSLDDIKKTLEEMAGKHVLLNNRLDRLTESKADRVDVEVLKTMVYRMAGIAAVISTVAGVLISKILL